MNNQKEIAHGALYAQALKEAQNASSDRDQGLWAIAFAMTDGDPARCQAEYVRQRVSTLTETAKSNKQISLRASGRSTTFHIKKNILIITSIVAIVVLLSSGIAFAILSGRSSSPEFVVRKALKAAASGDIVTFFANAYLPGGDFQKRFDSATKEEKRVLAEAQMVNFGDLRDYAAKLQNAKILRTEKWNDSLIVVFEPEDGEDIVELRMVNGAWKVWMD